MSYKAGFYEANEELFGNNVELALSLVQNKSGGKIYFNSNKPELDHIFPKSILYEKGVDAQEVNSLGNLWILPKGVNGNKSAKHPHDFLEPVDDEMLKLACIDRNALDYRSFRSFVKQRQQALSERLIGITGLNTNVFKSLEKPEDDPLPD